jgi:hypothetical protein
MVPTLDVAGCVGAECDHSGLGQALPADQDTGVEPALVHPGRHAGRQLLHQGGLQARRPQAAAPLQARSPSLLIRLSHVTGRNDSSISNSIGIQDIGKRYEGLNGKEQSLEDGRTVLMVPGFVLRQASRGGQSAAGAVPAGVPADLLLHAQRGEVLPPAVLRRRAPLVLPGRLAPARIQRAPPLPQPQVAYCQIRSFFNTSLWQHLQSHG